MNCPIFHHSLILASVLFLGGLASGCATVVAPLSDSNNVFTDESDGLLFGNMRLTWHGSDRTEGIKQPQGMRWTLEEVVKGKRFVVADLPTDGPFVLKLPAGSYRVTNVGFNRSRGVWHTELPTAFEIRPGECTSLGTSDIQMHAGLFAGWITREVANEQGLAHDDLGRMVGVEGCKTVVAPLESPLKRPVKLGFHTRGSNRS